MPEKRILELISGEGWKAHFKDGEYYSNSRVVAFALVENETGQREVLPMVAVRGIVQFANLEMIDDLTYLPEVTTK